jgi:hypothetical protein
MIRICSATAVLLCSIGAADLPVREVVLFKNGVAFFGRAGDLKAGEAARLEFKASEMNDLLKSLTVYDGAGSKVTAVRYDSAEPLDRRLAEFPIQLGSGQPVAVFLDRMKGSQLTVRYGGENLTGTILGARLSSGGKEQAEKELVTLLLDSGDIRTLDLGGVAGLRFTDPAVERQLKGYLGVLSQGRVTDRRNVYIDSTSSAARKIAASYMIPAPVWKSSYRLILGEQPMLEGWAIVDNTTADDWTGIRLSLVSGRPVSFISRLYEPKYRQRPFGDLAEETPVGPQVYEGGVIGGIMGAAGVPPPPPAPAAVAPMRKSLEARFRSDAAVSTEAMQSGPSNAAVNTAGREIGELFEYGFSTPVTIKRGESAMLPFLQDKVSSRKLLIYSDESTVNPMNAAEITNSTGKTLDGGPITVYDSGSYAGEALVETLKAGDKRLISYAVELGTRVTTSLEHERDFIREIHLNRGVLTSKSAQQETKVYTIKNVDQKAKTLMIEHPIREGYKLLNAKPVETAAHKYRFEVKLAPGAEVKFPVAEENVYENTTAIQSQTPDALLTFLQNKAISEAGRRALQSIVDRKNELAATDAELARLQAETTEQERDQVRLRQNISSLARVSGQEQQVQQYSRQLAAGETRIAALRDQAGEQRRKRQTLQSALNELIARTVF